MSWKRTVSYERKLWDTFILLPTHQKRQEIIEYYQPLIKIIAAQIYVKRVGNYLQFDDLYQSGNVGLLEAIERFDPERGASFKTFAEPRIRGEMLNTLDHYNDVMCQLCSRKQLLKERMLALSEGQSGLALLSSISVGLAIGLMLEETSMICFSEDDERYSPEMDTGYQSYFIEQTARRLSNAVKNLPEVYQQLVELHYYQYKSFTEIALELKISKGRVSQRHKELIEHLRQQL